MNCQEVEQFLMQYDGIAGCSAPDGVVGRERAHAGVQSADVERHLAECGACAALARKLRRLDEAVRSLPVPPRVETIAARMRFEQKLRSLTPAAAATEFAETNRPSHRVAFWRSAGSRWAAAAVLLLAIGGGVWGYHAHQGRAVASAEAIDKLVDWNLQLAQNDNAADRERFYRESAQNVKQQVGNAPLSDDDKEVAYALVEDGEFFSKTDDPLAQADRFSHVADLLVTKMGRAARKNPKSLDRLGQSYLSVVDRGIKRNLDRAEAIAGSGDSEEHQKRMEKIIQRNIQLEKRLEALLEEAPPAAHPPLRKALDATKQHAFRPANKRQQQKQQQNSGGASTPAGKIY